MKGTTNPDIGFGLGGNPVSEPQLASLTRFNNVTEEHLRGNLVGIKTLRSYIAKAGNLAQLLFSWRPFLGEIWASLGEASLLASGALAGCVWIKQIRPALLWIRASCARKQERSTECILYRPTGVEATAS